MNIMIVTDRPDDVKTKLTHLQYMKHPPKQFLFSIGFENEKVESALTPIWDLEGYRNPYTHVFIVAKDIDQIWQGSRKLLDMVIQTTNDMADDWFLMLIKHALTLGE